MAYKEALALIGRRAPIFLALVLLLYGPYELAYRYVETAGLLPEQALNAVFGFVGLVVGPIHNAAVVYLVSHMRAGVNEPLSAALKVGVKCWSRLVAAYIAISFVMLGYLAVTVLPGGLLMLVMKWKSPYILIPFGAIGILYAIPRYAFVEALIVVEGEQPWQARQTSWLMTKGMQWKLIGFALLTYLPAVLLEVAADEVIDGFLPKVGVGLVASCLYVVPTVLCYVLYARAKAPKELST